MTNDATNDHLATIRAFFDAYAADDRDAISAVLAADIEWLIPGHHPLGANTVSGDRYRPVDAPPVRLSSSRD